MPPKPTGGRDWLLYGNGPGRTRHMRDVNLKPPFRRVWALNGGKLIEFQPVLAGGAAVRAEERRPRARAQRRHRQGPLAQARSAALPHPRPVPPGASVYFVANRGGYGGIAGSGPAKVVAITRRTGHVRWAKRLGAASESSPLVVGERVYVGSQDGTVYALSAQNGRILWRYHAGGPVKGALAYTHGRRLLRRLRRLGHRAARPERQRRVAQRRLRPDLCDGRGRVRARLHRQQERVRVRAQRR